MKPFPHKLSMNAHGDESAVSTVQALRRVWPQWGSRINDLEAKLKIKKGAGGKGYNWATAMGGDGLHMQRVHSTQVYAHARKTFHHTLPVPDSLDVTLGSGPEASAYLVMAEGTSPLKHRDLRTTIRRRLRVNRMEGSAGVCHHARTNRTICGAVHGHDGGRHAARCNIGGRVTQRHDDVRDALHERLESIGKGPKKEQEIPHWNTVHERASLDNVLSDARLGEVCVDVSVVTTVTNDAGRGVLRGIERRERKKHLRYPRLPLRA